MGEPFEGAPAGKGAAFAWAGNSKVGEGRMTITESRPGELVRLKLEFLKPFEATNTAEFTFKPEGERTAVTWSMYGHNKFIARAVGLRRAPGNRPPPPQPFRRRGQVCAWREHF